MQQHMVASFSSRKSQSSDKFSTDIMSSLITIIIKLPPLPRFQPSLAEIYYALQDTSQFCQNNYYAVDIEPKVNSMLRHTIEPKVS